MIIRFAGFGGQGIVLSSYILGRAAALDGKKAIQNQAYGSESRGGECRGDVIISDEEIYELEPDRYDVLVALAQPAYDKFIGAIKPAGTLIIDSDLVIPDNNLQPPGLEVHGLSATDIAFKKFGRKIIANMVILGFINTVLHLVSEDALARAISGSVPRGTAEVNLKALSEGIALARRASAAGESRIPASPKKNSGAGKRGSKQ